MKLKPFFLWLLLIMLFVQPFAMARADYPAMVDEYYAYACAGGSMQAWIDGPLSENAGGSTDNYIIDLCHREHGYNLSGYIEAASAMVQPGALNNPVSRQRCALTLIACGAIDRVPEGLADETIGKLGVMSYAYGLHLLNNGAPSAIWTSQSLVEKLLSLQLPDGGWAVMGSFGDTDVTAMCLQALTGCGESDARNEAIERGLEFLSSHQLENGRFAGMSLENSESCTQVVLALASLGIDPAADPRFIKNGISVLDAFLEFRLPSGGFAHLPGEAENESAGIQAIQALTALSRSGMPYFDFSLNPAPGAVRAAAAKPALPAWKQIALISIGVLLLLGVLFALSRKRGRIKQLLMFAAIALAAAAAVLSLNIESAQDYYGAAPQPAGEPIGSAYITIRCTTVDGSAAGISADGVILERTEFPICEGESAFDLLIKAARSSEIQLEHEGGTGDMAYVNGIHYLYEYQHGDLSGWVYSVNGVRPSIGSGSYALADGDEVVWEYTKELGEDLK